MLSGMLRGPTDMGTVMRARMLGIIALVLALATVAGALAAIAIWRDTEPFPARGSAAVTGPGATFPAGTGPAPAAGVMVYRYNAPESQLDRRYDYHWKILQTALERTREKWSDYRMEPAVFMSEQRQSFELMNATGKLTVMYLGTTPEFEKRLVPIRIPVDKNLGGYMVFLIRKEDQARFSAITTLDELRKLKIGLGLGWVDVDILRHDGFTIVTGSDYDGLFHMLANGRFDAFSRAAVEILDEYAERKEQIPSMHIEESLLLYYPLPMYFWFSRTPEGQKLADRAREGMLAMIADGTYDKIFMEYQRHKIDQLHLKDRRIFEVENPLLGPETPFSDKRLWFDPRTAN
jgi:hypothetical protein